MSLTEPVTDRISREWDRLRELDLGVQNEPLEERQKAVIRMLAPDIPKCISVRDWLPHFQKRGKLFSEGEEQELLLEQTTHDQGIKLASLLVQLSNGRKPVLTALLLSLMDSYEVFDGGKSTYGHWTCMEILLDAVHSVDGRPPYQLPSVSEVLPKLDEGLELKPCTVIAFADALGVGHAQFTSYKCVVQRWLRTNKNCSFVLLVQALLCTRGLGRLVTGLCSACRSNPPTVLNWFMSLSTEDLRRVALFVGLSSEMVHIESKYCNDKKIIPQIFLRCLRIPDCGDALRDILYSLGKATEVKVSQTGAQRPSITVHHKGQQQTSSAENDRVDRILTLLELEMKKQSASQISPISGFYPDGKEVCLSPEVHGASVDLETHRSASPKPKSKTELPAMQICEDQPEDESTVQGKELLDACRTKDWETALTLLQTQGPEDTFIELCDKATGKTALHYAFESGKLELTEQLMELGADITKLTRTGLSVLNYPRVFRSEDTLRRVLVTFKEKDCSVDTAGNENRNLTPLMLVCYEGDALFASAQLLLDSGASPEGNIRACSCPLIAACEGGHRRLVELLLAKGALLNTQDRSGSTGLLQACRHRQLEIAGILLEQSDTNVNLSDKSGSTPLFEVVSANNVPLATRLLDLGARVNITREISNEIMTGSIEETPLAHACARGFEELVELLVDKNADLNYLCAGTVPPIAFAIIGHQNHITERLLKYNALSSSIDDLSASIISAVRVENYECAKKLIDRLGGAENAFRQASEKGNDLLATHIRMFESTSDSSHGTFPNVSLKMNTRNHSTNTNSISQADATLDRFCHICVLALREYEITGNTTLQDLSSIARALHPGSPNIPEFLSQITSYQVNSGLQKLFLHGRPSALTFLIHQKVLTKDGFVVQALKYYNNSPEDFYEKLVSSFQAIPRGENLPNDIDGVLNHLFTHKFQINITTSSLLTARDGFPSNDVLPEEFQVKNTPPNCNYTQVGMPNLDAAAFPRAATLPERLSAGVCSSTAGEGQFPPNNLLPKEFQVHAGTTNNFPRNEDLPVEFRVTETQALPPTCTRYPDCPSNTADQEESVPERQAANQNDLSNEEPALMAGSHDQCDICGNPNTSQTTPTGDLPQSLLPNTDNTNEQSVGGLPIEVTSASPPHPATRPGSLSLQGCSSDSMSLFDMGPETPESERETLSVCSWKTPTSGYSSNEHVLHRPSHSGNPCVPVTNRRRILKQQRARSPTISKCIQRTEHKSRKKPAKPPVVKQTKASVARQKHTHPLAPPPTQSTSRKNREQKSVSKQLCRTSKSTVCPQLDAQQGTVSLDQAVFHDVFNAGMCLADAPTNALLTTLQFEQSQHQFTRYSVKVSLGAEIVWKDEDYYIADANEEFIRKELSRIFTIIRSKYSQVDGGVLIDVKISGV